MTNDTADSPKRNWAAPYFTIWTAQVFSLLGSQLVSFALIWYMAQKTGSANVLAMASLVSLLPQVFLAPVAGALVDRLPRRLVIIVADGSIALATLLLAALFYTGQVQIWHIYALMFLRSVGGGFHYPAMQASTSLMVPREHLARVQGMNQMLNGGLNIVSAPLGALLLELMPVHGVLMIDIFTALIGMTPLFFIPIPQPVRTLEPDTPGEKTSLWKDMASGFRYAFGWPGLVMVGIMATLINMLLTPASALTPILVRNYFNGDAFHLAWMESALGVGVLVGGTLLSVWGGFKRQIITSLMGVTFIGVGLGAVGFVPSTLFPLAVVMMFFAGVALPIANGPLMAVVQSTVEPEMQGRVFTLMGSVANAMSPLGLIFAGPVAEAYGAQVWFIVGGAVAILMGIGAFFVPAIVRIEEGRPGAKKTLKIEG